jgi:hypothetical protein
MINDKISKIFDDIFKNNLNKTNYLIHYRYIYDISNKQDECETQVVYNSIKVNYQTLLNKSSEELNNLENNEFLDKYYELYNNLQKHNITINKLFSYFFQVNKLKTPSKIFLNYWCEYIVSISINKLTNIFIDLLKLNKVPELIKIINNFKEFENKSYFLVISDCYLTYVKNETKNIINKNHFNVEKFINFFENITNMNKLFLDKTIHIVNEFINEIVIKNFNNLLNSLKDQNKLLINNVEEIVFNNYNICDKFSKQIDIVNLHYKLLIKFNEKETLQHYNQLLKDLFNEKILGIFKDFNVKILLTYLEFIDLLYDNIDIQKYGVTYNFYDSIIKEKIENIVNSNDFIKSLLKYLNQNITKNINYVKYLGVIISALKDKDLFGILYKKSLVKRIVQSRKINYENEVLYMNKLLFFNNIDCSSRVQVILNDYKKSLTSDKEFLNINHIPSKVLVTTFDMWDIKPSLCNFVSKEFEEKYNNFKSEYDLYYNCRNENKTLQWCDNLSNCVIIFECNELICSLEQADILSLFNNCDKICLDNYNIKPNILDSLIDSKILNFHNNLLFINPEFKINNTLNLTRFLKLKNKKNSLKTMKEKLLWEKETYIDAFIIKYLKKTINCDKNTLFEKTFEKYENLQIQRDFFEKRIEKLKDKDYISIENNILKYIP